MAVGDDVMKDSESSLNVKNLDSEESGDALSPEDLAWVDSCLLKDPEFSYSNLDSLKDVLLEIIDSHSEEIISSADVNNINDLKSQEKNDYNLVPMNLEPETVNNVSASSNLKSIVTETSAGDHNTRSDQLVDKANGPVDSGKIQLQGRNDADDDVSINVKSETVNGVDLNRQKARIFLSEILESETTETTPINPFLPTYKEGNEVGEAFDLGPDLEDLSFGEDLLSDDDIFKVWDLGVADEEDDELIKQLKKALTEPSNDSETWKDLKDDSLGNLIAGISDLSLSQNSS